VQFEEKKYLETAKKLIQNSIANVGQRIETDPTLQK
jgi:hypothetical protein